MVAALDLTSLRRDGFQRLPAAFDPAAASEELEGFARSPVLQRIAEAVLGPGAVVAGRRFMTDDDLRGVGAAPRQDWAYGPGGVRELSLLLPLEPLDGATAGPGFFVGSHRYGPLSRGPLDPSRLPPMAAITPATEVGDVLICDPLVWRFGVAASGAAIPKIAWIVYRARPTIEGGSDWSALVSRFDASGAPSTELNAREARRRFEHGDFEGAVRFARGLIADDPDHAAAALVLHDVLAAFGDPAAAGYLERGRAALSRLAVQTAVRIARVGEGRNDDAWSTLDVAWLSVALDDPTAPVPPGVFATPGQPWAYGAVSDPVPLIRAEAIRLRVCAERGRVGFCLVSDDQTRLLSDQSVVTPDLGETDLFLPFDPSAGSARLCLRNFGDPGVEGRVRVLAMHSRPILAF